MESQRNMRPKTSGNGKENSGPIPVDLIIEILSRLPAKSIARSRCVTKLWDSILGLPYFTELFLTRASARPQLLFAYKGHSESLFLSSPQPQNPDENSSPIAANRLTHFPFGGQCEISSPVHGLVCLTYNQSSEGTVQMIVCNPSTGQSLRLPKIKTVDLVISFLGYDPIDKQFKVLLITESTDSSCEHKVLTLGTQELSWRMIECCIPHCLLPKGICINGVLYYPATTMSTGAFVIVCFHVRSEKFSFIEVETNSGKAVFVGTMINYNGKLGSLVSHGSRCVGGGSRSIKLLVIGDFEKQEWSMHKYVLPPLWMDVVGEGLLRFVGVIGTNEIVLSHPSRLIYYNVEKETIVRIEIQGMEAFHWEHLFTFLDHVEDVKLIKAF